MLARWFGVCLLILICPAATYGQAYVFRGANYSYLHSPWFQIDGCSRDGTCAFQLEGLLSVEIGPWNSPEFVTAELELIGNEELIDNPLLEYAPITGDAVAELLRDTELTLVADKGDTHVYRWDRGDFQMIVSPSLLRLQGGYNMRFADGDGVLFDATGHRTWLGDANLDLEFGSDDFVQVFAEGLYEDEVPLNSTWATGDWNGDKDFDSADLVAAFREGGYDQGRYKANAVPEPASCVLLIAGLLAIAVTRIRIAGCQLVAEKGFSRY